MYLCGVEIAPPQSVGGVPEARIFPAPEVIDSILLEELWRKSDAATYGFTLKEFEGVLTNVGRTKNHGLPSGHTASREQQTTFFVNLRLSDLILARACADGRAGAWEHFLALYRQPLIRAAITITRNATLGHDIADALYAELYGLTTREGQRHSPLDSYMGTGSLIGWLRTTLAQRHFDHHRHSYRETPLDDYDPSAPEPERAQVALSVLGNAVEEAIRQRNAKERFLLVAYYLDECTLHQIGAVLNVRESTISRWLKRTTDDLRKQVLRNLQGSGLSRRAAEEALGVDPRDLELNLKKLLQNSHSSAFPEKTGK
jgi:RNA polymerase sigma-70 factor (ECF subfamily)